MIKVLWAFLLLASTATADKFVVAQGGTWGATCPPVVCSAPGDSWHYSFYTDSFLNFSFGLGQLVSPVTGFEFDLNGSPVTAPPGGTPFFALWFPQINNGGFALLVGDTEVGPLFAGPLFVQWTQLFQFNISHSSGTLIPGSYAVQPVLPLGSGEILYGATSGFTPDPVVIGPVPEPPTSIILLATAVIGVGFAITRKFLSLLIRIKERVT